MKVTRNVPLPPPAEYTIVLNQDEVDVLATVVGNIIGDGRIRNTTSKLFEQLHSAGASTRSLDGKVVAYLEVKR